MYIYLVTFYENKKYFILTSFIISIIAIVLFVDIESNGDHYVNPSFGTTSNSNSSGNNISEFMKQGDYNGEMRRDYHKAIEFYDKVH